MQQDFVTDESCTMYKQYRKPTQSVIITHTSHGNMDSINIHISPNKYTQNFGCLTKHDMQTVAMSCFAQHRYTSYHLIVRLNVYIIIIKLCYSHMYAKSIPFKWSKPFGELTSIKIPSQGAGKALSMASSKTGTCLMSVTKRAKA